jgi:hypothetical protein
MAPPCDVVGPSPRSGEAEAPLRSSLSSEVEVESEPRVGRGGDHRLRPRLSPSPGVGRGGVRRLSEPRPSPSPGVERGRVRCLPGPRPSPGSGEAEFVVFRGRVRALGRARRSSSSSGAEAEFEPWVGRGGVRRLPGPRPSPSPGLGEAELPMTPEAGLGCCQPHSVERHNSRSDTGGAVLLSGRSVERRSDCGHFGSVD